MTKGIQDVLAALLVNLQFLAITVGPYTFQDRNERLEEERMWWRICRQEGNGRGGVAEPISHGEGDQLRERLHKMDYKSLMSLRTSYIGSL